MVRSGSCKAVANRSTNICKAEDSAYMQSHLPHVVTMTVEQCMGSLKTWVLHPAQLTCILSILNLQIYQPSFIDLKVWLCRSKDQ